MWPEISRRERLEKYTRNLLGTHETLRFENQETDQNNFLKNVFLLEKFAEKNQCKTFHCFSDTYIDFRSEKDAPALLEDYTLRNCWPHWDKFTARDLHAKPSKAKDGIHFGTEHHERFAKLFLEKFANKLV